jgi:NAD+ kinase
MIDKHGATIVKTQGYSVKDIAQQSDLAIVIGGDGTFLQVGRDLVDHKIPILGINLGHLGFLVDISPNEMMSILDQILKGNYCREERILLQANVYRQEQLLGTNMAFNDIVIHVRNEVRMIELTTYINNSFVNTQRADGMIISTPTGSTAYSLSSGGPLLHPSLNALVLVPICPHALSYRPIVIPSSDHIDITLCDKPRNGDARVSFDGQPHIDIEPGDAISIKQKEQTLCLIHPKDYDYYHILRTKLHWSVQF